MEPERPGEVVLRVICRRDIIPWRGDPPPLHPNLFPIFTALVILMDIPLEGRVHDQTSSASSPDRPSHDPPLRNAERKATASASITIHPFGAGSGAAQSARACYARPNPRAARAHGSSSGQFRGGILHDIDKIEALLPTAARALLTPGQTPAGLGRQSMEGSPTDAHPRLCDSRNLPQGGSIPRRAS
jgi:hypothetical protein